MNSKQRRRQRRDGRQLYPEEAARFQAFFRAAHDQLGRRALGMPDATEGAVPSPVLTVDILQRVRARLLGLPEAYPPPQAAVLLPSLPQPEPWPRLAYCDYRGLAPALGGDSSAPALAPTLGGDQAT